MIRIRTIAIAAMTAFALAGCSGIESERSTPDTLKTPEDLRKERYGKLFGEDAFTYGGTQRAEEDAGSGGLGVNSYLWRASLDTVTFMPVNSADPFGGVIITDWYTPPESPSDERFKLNIYILGRALRADGVRVAVFRQTKDGSAWNDAAVKPDVGTKIEDAILMKARQLRHETLNQ